MEEHIQVLWRALHQEPRMGQGANDAILVKSFLVHVLDRTRYRSDKMVIGRTSIILKVVSFFLGVTILAKWRVCGHWDFPSKNSFQSWMSLSRRQSGTHIKSGWVHPQHPGEVVVLVWRMACFKSVIGSLCPETTFSIHLELIVTSHVPVGRSRPPCSNNVPNHERRHFEVLGVEFRPLKLNSNWFGKLTLTQSDHSHLVKRPCPPT